MASLILAIAALLLAGLGLAGVIKAIDRSVRSDFWGGA